MSQLDELLQFLTLETRLDLKSLALQQVLGLTGTKEGRQLLCQNPLLFNKLCQLFDDQQPSVATDASLALVNLSADEEFANEFFSKDCDIIEKLISIILNPDHELTDPCCMALSNLTRRSCGCENAFPKVSQHLDKLIDIFCQENYNKKGAKLHYLASLLSNLSQIPPMREYIMDKSRCVLQRLSSFTDYKKSVVRRGGIIGMIKNCCFQTENHEWLLSSSVDLLPKLLLPLAGPEEFSDEENDKLPIELQYLGDDKVREEDPDIRKMLIEALIQLCATKFGREYLRSKNTYIIMRELHKWEKDHNVLVACENLVDILIKYEHEIGHDNLRELEIPKDVEEKLVALQEDLLHS
nr:EOG090X08WK [Cyclestheria hislopi]